MTHHGGAFTAVRPVDGRSVSPTWRFGSVHDDCLRRSRGWGSAELVLSSNRVMEAAVVGISSNLAPTACIESWRRCPGPGGPGYVDCLFGPE